MGFESKEAAAAAESMREQAGSLQSAVSFFRLEAGVHVAPLENRAAVERVEPSKKMKRLPVAKKAPMRVIGRLVTAPGAATPRTKPGNRALSTPTGASAETPLSHQKYSA